MDIEELLMIIAMIIIGALLFIGVVLIFDALTVEKEIPLNCGITQENKSESYTTTTYTLVGKIFVPSTVTHYRHDLVCTNGTTILEYQ